MKRLLIALFSVFIVTACTQGSAPTDTSEIAAGTDAWEAALNNGDLEALGNLYAEDARLMAPNAVTTVGRDNVRTAFAGMVEAGISADLTIVEIIASGDLGVKIGTYVLTAGETQVDVGKFIETWALGDDGEWQMTNDIYNSDLPAAAPEPAASGPMAHLMITHEVEDAERWLEAWRGEDSRHKLFKANGAAHVNTVQDPDNPNMTGLIIAVADMDALTAMLESEEGQAAAAADGVKPETMKMLVQAK